MPPGVPELVVDVEVAARGHVSWSPWFAQGLLSFRKTVEVVR